MTEKEVLKGVIIVNIGAPGKYRVAVTDDCVVFDFEDHGLVIKDYRERIRTFAQQYLQEPHGQSLEAVQELMFQALAPAKFEAQKESDGTVTLLLSDNVERQTPEYYFSISYAPHVVKDGDFGGLGVHEWMMDSLNEEHNKEVQPMINEIFSRTTDENFGEEFVQAITKMMGPSEEMMKYYQELPDKLREWVNQLPDSNKPIYHFGERFLSANDILSEVENHTELGEVLRDFLCSIAHMYGGLGVALEKLWERGQ